MNDADPTTETESDEPTELTSDAPTEMESDAPTETESDAPTDPGAAGPERAAPGSGSTTGSDLAAGSDPAAESDGGGDPPRPSGQRGLPDGSAATYLYWGLLVALGLLALLALFRFYTSASRAIAVWIAPSFEPVLLAAFNLAVLLAACVGISLVVRELNG